MQIPKGVLKYEKQMFFLSFLLIQRKLRQLFNEEKQEKLRVTSFTHGRA